MRSSGRLHCLLVAVVLLYASLPAAEASQDLGDSSAPMSSSWNVNEGLTGLSEGYHSLSNPLQERLSRTLPEKRADTRLTDQALSKSFSSQYDPIAPDYLDLCPSFTDSRCFLPRAELTREPRAPKTNHRLSSPLTLELYATNPLFS